MNSYKFTKNIYRIFGCIYLEAFVRNFCAPKMIEINIKFNLDYMKMNHSKILKIALPVFAFLTTISTVAKTTHQVHLKQDGPEPPPGVAIDNYILLLLASAVIFAGIYFFKKRNVAETRL